MDPNDADLTPYGQWVRQQREKLGLRHVELAKRAGISLAQIYNIETGRTKNPQAGTRQRLAQVLAGNAETPCGVVDLPQRPKEPPQHDGEELVCSFCKRTLEQVRVIAWTSDERDPTACLYCVDELNSIFAKGARHDRYDGKAKLRLIAKTTATGQS